MHSKKNSILKRWHSLTAKPKSLQKKWVGQFWLEDSDYLRSVQCANCRSFNRAKQECSISFGTPLRKCVVSSIEAHFNNCAGKDVLEIGFGRFMLARNLIRRSGGTWTGIEPQIDPGQKPVIGKGGHGDAANIPFPDNTFDMAFGIQSIEHWGQKVGGRTPSNYSECLAEICRVIKPGGNIYFDAPIYFHGHEMFIANDLPRIRALFSDDLWREVKIEKWREQYQPLERYPPPTAVLQRDWPVELESYTLESLEPIREHGSVYMIAITANKK
ncbi:MAG: class I SAM-dependent methyltransferase [Pseudomonadales bacterium]|nr:class I SAM-dependent methyltransferase [Pseudomonadales bacterium]